ncbi:hypothetical protein SAMN04488058_101313 [Deinococcus reticulitermitis]|uniref:ParB-like nuclease domain-containing protein n=1 Tax=Deinococcus reticulitermitis TaxID=856736 RepID=A0A1H6SI94_9DEIO|nr:hypothetical protein [Deinococcus reticulitermitis]SEI67611.1 hypothetical protein SAMN04488058_101313 [Deinococcus reticulitermitis]
MTRKKTDTALRIEYLPLDELSRWPGNPKSHDDGAIAASISRFGFRDPLAIDEATGRLVAGHGRLTALERAHAAGSAAPQFVQVRGDGMWLVPVTRGGSFGDEAEAAAYLVATNRTGELGGWDESLLAEFLKPLDEDLLSITGFDLDAFLREVPKGSDVLPSAPSEFLNDLIAPVSAPAAAGSGSAENPEAGLQAPAAPAGQPASPLPAAQTDEPYLQVVYVVRKSEREQVLEAVKRARARFSVETAPEAFMAIIRDYLSREGQVAA